MSKDKQGRRERERRVQEKAIRKRADAAIAGLRAGQPILRMFPEMRWFIYPFFGLHMFMFGLSGFLIAYSDQQPDVGFLYMHGGMAIVVYLMFYLKFFGRDDVKWMLINAGLGLMGIYSQIGWILERFDRYIDDYAWYVHCVPFLYYVLYTFLLRQILLDATGSRNDPVRRKRVEAAYVAVSLVFYGVLLWRGNA
jgi:hypothetical protein